MNSLMQDVRYALRQLRKSPGFALTAILTLALGIGASTAIFTVVDSVILQPLAFRNFQQLTYLHTSVAAYGDTIDASVNPELFRLYQERCPAFAEMVAYQGGTKGFRLGDSGTPEEIGVLSATQGLFHLLGTHPILGRTFTPEEYVDGHGHVVVISNALWRRVFHADAKVAGRTLRLGGVPYTIVGVLPPSLRMPPELMGFTESGVRRGADIYRPLVLPLASTDPMSDWNYFAIARLRPGATLPQANAEMNAILAPLAAKAGGNVRVTTAAVPLRQAINGDAARGLWILLAAVGCVLLIACMNLANVQLARARVRAREHAIRAALGASSTRLFQSALAESMLLAVAGGTAGVFVAIAGVKAFLLAAPSSLPRTGQVHLRWETLAAVLLLTLGTGLLFGLAPAWTALRTDPQNALRASNERTVGGRHGRSFRATLIAVEVAASAVLLMAAALLTHSFLRLMQKNLGFVPQHVVAAEIDLGDARYKNVATRIQMYRRVLPALQQLPGVRSAGFVTALPMHGNIWIDGMNIPGDTRPEGARPDANFRWVSPGYLPTMKIPLVEGRLMAERDLGTHNVVISQAAARAAWPDQDPIGRTFTRGDETLTVVGVVGNTHSRSLTSEPDRMVYLPYTDVTPFSATGYFMVRGAGDTGSLVASIERAIHATDPTIPIPEVRTLPQVIRASVALEHFEMVLLLAFGLSALALAALGIYGVLAVSVAERTRDVAVRIALGASKGRILIMVVREGMVPTFAGLLAGLFAGWAIAHFAQVLLPDVSPADPLAAGTTALLLPAIAFAACLLPAWRAAAVDPNTILRSE